MTALFSLRVLRELRRKTYASKVVSGGVHMLAVEYMRWQHFMIAGLRYQTWEKNDVIHRYFKQINKVYSAMNKGNWNGCSNSSLGTREGVIMQHS